MAELRQMAQAEYVAWTVYFGRMAQREELEKLKAQASGR